MLPAIIAGSALAKTPIVAYLLRSGFFVALATAAYFIVRKLVNTVRRTGAINKYGDTKTVDGKSTQYANQLYQAMVRSNSFLNNFFGDGTDTQGIYSTAAEMHSNGISFAAVSKKFSALFNKDLLKMLNSELDSQEMQRFNQILSSGLSGIIVKTLLKTKGDAYVLDSKFRPIQLVPSSTNLGMHLESIIYGNDQRYDGFMYNGKMRYIDGNSVEWLNEDNNPLKELK